MPKKCARCKRFVRGEGAYYCDACKPTAVELRESLQRVYESDDPELKEAIDSLRRTARDVALFEGPILCTEPILDNLRSIAALLERKQKQYFPESA
jgi:hypothetical protein